MSDLIVLDPKGVGYSDFSGTHIIPKDEKIDPKLIEKGLITKPALDRLIKVGRVSGSIKLDTKQDDIVDNKKMPEVDNKKLKTDKKGKKKK